jgi:hypothetical protein
MYSCNTLLTSTQVTIDFGQGNDFTLNLSMYCPAVHAVLLFCRVCLVRLAALTWHLRQINNFTAAVRLKRCAGQSVWCLGVGHYVFCAEITPPWPGRCDIQQVRCHISILTFSGIAMPMGLVPTHDMKRVTCRRAAFKVAQQQLGRPAVAAYRHSKQTLCCLTAAR